MIAPIADPSFSPFARVGGRSHITLLLASAFLEFLTSLWAGCLYAPTGDDSQDYTLLAHNVAQGHGLSLSGQTPYQPSAVRAPVYPLFLALVYRMLGDSHEMVLLAQALVLAIGSALLTKLALIVFDMRVAVVTTALFAANPYFGRWAGSLLTEGLYLTLIIACVYTFTMALRCSRLEWFTATGMLWAVATLCRPLTVVLLPLMLLGILLYPTVAHQARNVAALVLFGGLGLLPWTVRNWLAFDAFIPLQTQAFGSNFWLTTLPLEDQPIVTWEGIEDKWQGKYPERDYAVPAGKDTLAQRKAESHLVTAALRRIEENPTAYLLARARSWPRLWLHSGGLWYGRVSIQSALSSGRYGVVAVKVLLFLLLSFLPLMLGLIGIYLCRSNLPPVFPLLMVPILIGIMHLPLWIEDRYGMPAVPFLIIFAALTLVRLVFAKLRALIARRFHLRSSAA